ncbi:MAG: RagB/SusD family nutrient uptake outer membrane protein [Prevotellaceae bacterium]|nr:RagB/SusD family nutrient uptake outer membrane protein [Prevotellaceae bacterium]MDO4931098.1 RagB/SusD family nutrient uptake outer membrane protein [Prevotellaceae bacterium]
MKKILLSIIAVFGLFSVTSCGDMLETDNDSMVTDPSLGSKTDSVFYALGIAQAMQQLADQYFYVGEMRGELVSPTSATNTNLRQLADYSANTSNRYDSAYVYYKVINNCNYYLAHRDTTLYTGSQNVTINEYAAVAAWRAWAYLQLARTYGGNEQKIPFYTQPLTALTQINEDNCDKKTLVEIVEELAPQLEKFSGLEVPNFGGTSFGIGTTNWGNSKSINPARIFVPVDVVLGEMYLEAGQWLKAAQHYCKYLCDNHLTTEKIMSFPQYSMNSSTMSDLFPDDFHFQYNTILDNYGSVFASLPSPIDVVTYIPMAVSSMRGTITSIPLAFGYDYYSTDRSTICPRVDAIQIAPSKAFHELVDSSIYYYYPRDPQSPNAAYPSDVKYAKLGDGRASRYKGRSDVAILNMDINDTTKVYISKNNTANVYLFRESTIYLHLAEALNRLGYPELAFAILRNGISTYLEDLVPGANQDPANPNPAPEPYKYMTQAAIELLKTQVPFLDATNRNIFVPESTYGIHNHGAGTENAVENENLMTVQGSQATAVGSKNNLHYLPEPIISAKLAELSEIFPDITFGGTKADTINAMEDILCDEYAKEFAFEGKRFYDLQRMARHKNESGLYGGNFGSRWFANKLKGNNPAVDLTVPKNWYLPFK